MSPTFASFRLHNYRLWFAGALVSNIGTWMQRVAQDWFVLTVLTADSGFAVGVVTALQFLPILLLSPYAGLVADRLPRRHLLIATQAAQGLLALGKGRRCVDTPQVCRNRLALFPAHIAQRVTHLMDDAELNLCLRVDGFYGFGKTFQAIHTGNEDVLHTPILQFRHHR